MFELEKQVARLKELRQLSKQIQTEAEQIRASLIRLAESVGGKLVVGSYILSITNVPVVAYAKVLDELKRNHPEIAAEIDELVGKFQTVSKRLDITETDQN
jgi:hypothetical protein